MRAGQLTTPSGRRPRAAEIVRTLVPRPTGPAAPDAGVPDVEAEETPVVLNRYRLRRRLGTGGFGTVWMARDERLERDVAVKILPRELVAEGRFEREAHAAARLSHPGIVTLYEAAADDEGAYLVSELVRGATLQRALAGGKLSDRGILEIGIAVCDALRHAHAHGVVHRDVKPSNILIPGNAPVRAKLTDFGVARLAGANTLTRTGDLVGTAAYMAPEQAEGREAGEEADLFSLALVLYEALTGVNPVPLPTGAVSNRRVAQHLPPLRRQRRELPRELGQAIDLALRPRPRERGTLDELRAVLVRAVEVVSDRPGVVEDPWPTRAVPDTRPDQAPARTRERRTAVQRTKRDEASARGQRPRGASARRPESPAPERAPAQARTRAWAAAAAAAVATWVVARLLVTAPIPAASAALIAALAVMALPRLGWIVLSGAAILLLAAQGRPGAALVFGLAAGLPVVLLPRRGSAWPLAAGAPLLGIVGLAGAWPALAARGRTTWERAALGALGWMWLVLCAALARRALYGPIPEPSSDVWASVAATARDVVGPLVPGGILAGAAVWALGAVTLPAVTRGRPGPGRYVVICAWAAAVAAGSGIALRLAGAGALAATPGRFMAGMGACAAVALIPPARARMRSGSQTDGAAARLA